MRRKVAESALLAMSEAKRSEALAQLVGATRGMPNGELKALRGEIARLEKEHGMSSEQLRADITAGVRKETWEYCQWLMLLRRRERLEARAARS